MLKSRMTNSMLRTIALVLSALWLTSCAGTVSSCPPLVEYEEEFEEQVIAELNALEGDAVLWIVVDDYRVLRNQIRACR